MTIVERILALLNVGEEAKINNFFEKQVKQYEREIKSLKKNIETLKDQETESIEELQEQIEDGNVRVDEAYASVTIDNLATNDLSSKFIDIYWERILNEEKKVKSLEKRIEDVKEKSIKEIENIQKQVDERERRISKIK